MTSNDGHFEREVFIHIEPQVRLREINKYYLDMFSVVARTYAEHGYDCAITGICCEAAYPVGGVHDINHAIDFKTLGIRDPLSLKSIIEERLKSIDKGYYVLYHDTGSGFHFHIAWKPDTTFPI